MLMHAVVGANERGEDACETEQIFFGIHLVFVSSSLSRRINSNEKLALAARISRT